MKSARAFTLLEVALASLLGLVVVMASFGVFTAIDRTDAMLRARAAQAGELERLHVVMSRAFLTFVVAERAPTTPARPPQDEQRPGQTPAPSPGGRTNPARTPGSPSQPQRDADGSAAASSGQSASVAPTTREAPAPTRPRVSLYTDPNLASSAMMRRAGVQGDVRPQRFEMLLADAPIRDSGAPGTSVVEDDLPAAPELLTPVGRVVRGAFELRPTETNDGREIPGSWSIWWVQADGDGRATSSIRVAEGLSYVHWRCFQKRERLDTYQAIGSTELPAYIEMDVETTSGLTASWMFEIGWFTGSDPLTVKSGTTSDSKSDEASGAADGASSTQPPTGASRIRTVPSRGGAS